MRESLKISYHLIERGESFHMNGYQQEASVWDKLTGTMPLSATRSAVIKQTYILFGLSVLGAMAGGYIGATSETMVRFFSGWMGWIAAMVLLNVVPQIAIAARHNPVLGVSALAFDGFISGIALSPLLYYASRVAPNMIVAALGITGFVFLGVTAYIMTSGRTFSAPKGLMMGLFFSIMGAMILNSFMHIGVLGILISVGIGAMGVCTLVYSTSSVLATPDADSAIPGALMLFAGVFNIFVAALNILLRLMGGGSNRD
jgi:modulator of FtsH protease